MQKLNFYYYFFSERLFDENQEESSNELMRPQVMPISSWKKPNEVKQQFSQK